MEILITTLKLEKPELRASDIFTVGTNLLSSVSKQVNCQYYLPTEVKVVYRGSPGFLYMIVPSSKVNETKFIQIFSIFHLVLYTPRQKNGQRKKN